MINRWSDNKDEQLIAYIGEGKSHGQIARIFHVTIQAVASKCKRMGLKAANPRSQTWNEERDEILRTMIDEGRTFTEIAERLKIERGCISGRCHRLGLRSKSGVRTGGRGGSSRVRPPRPVRLPPPPKPTFWTDARVAKFRQMWADGTSVIGIAEALGCTAKSIARKREKLDLPLRRHGGLQRSTGFKFPPSAVRIPPAPVDSDKPTTDGFTLIDRPKRGCKWPIYAAPSGFGYDTRFCGLDAGLATYCEAHHDLAYRRNV